MARNARVNFHKTEVVFLSGKYTEWKQIATSANIIYHTNNSPTAAHYLGYPLALTDAQLRNFLRDIKLEIQQSVIC